MDIKIIRKYFKNNGISNNRLADFMGYTPSHISCVLNGKSTVSKQFTQLLKIFLLTLKTDRDIELEEAINEVKSVDKKNNI